MGGGGGSNRCGGVNREWGGLFNVAKFSTIAKKVQAKTVCQHISHFSEDQAQNNH